MQVWQFSHDCRSSVVLCKAPLRSFVGTLWSFAVFSHTRLCDPTFSRFSRTPTPTCDRQTEKQTDTEPCLVPSVVVLGLGLEVSSRTNFESLALALSKSPWPRQVHRNWLRSNSWRLSAVHQHADRCPATENCLSTIIQMRRFDKLCGLFSRLLCTPVTSAPVERVFSRSGLLLRPHRAHGCPTLCWKLWCFWSATVLHRDTCPPKINWLKLT